MSLGQKILLLFRKIFSKDVLIEYEKIVAYVSSKEILPMALSVDEEEELLSRLKDNDESAKSSLIEHNLRLVVYIAKKFDSSGCDLDDLISVGAIGLIKAVQSFDVDKKIKLATYASRCIENEILMFIRKKNKHGHEVSLDEPLSFDKNGNELLLADVLESEDSAVGSDMERDSEQKLLGVALSRLNPRERHIMSLRFGLGGNEEYTQKEVADLMGISQSYISRIEKKILFRLKKDLARLG